MSIREILGGVKTNLEAQELLRKLDDDVQYGDADLVTLCKLLVEHVHALKSEIEVLKEKDDMTHSSISSTVAASPAESIETSSQKSESEDLVLKEEGQDSSKNQNMQEPEVHDKASHHATAPRVQLTPEKSPPQTRPRVTKQFASNAHHSLPTKSSLPRKPSDCFNSSPKAKSDTFAASHKSWRM
jgi:hypothetical protein